MAVAECLCPEHGYPLHQNREHQGHRVVVHQERLVEVKVAPNFDRVDTDRYDLLA